MDAVELVQRSLTEMGRLVDGTTDDQLTLPTPCTEWSVRNLVNHVTGGAMMFTESIETGDVSDATMGRLAGDVLGDDWRGTFHTAVGAAQSTFGQDGVMEKTVKLPFGEMPAGIALNIAVMDLATHACDLATATGQKIEDAELIEAALAGAKQFISPQMRGAMFAEEQPCGDAATPVERLLAFTGRKV